MKKKKPRLTNDQKSGICLESLVADFIAGWLGFETEYDHNSFAESDYALDNHLVVDGQVGQTILIECTNFKKTTTMGDKVMLNKIDYFRRRDPSHECIWVFVVTHTSHSNFSKYIKKLIEIRGIHLVVLGLTATKENPEQIIDALYKSELFLMLKSRVRQFSFNNFTLTYNDV
jgi:hypothetical protein